MKVYLLTIFVVFGLLMPPVAPRQTITSFYVSTLGSDSNVGSFESPYRTISKAINVATDGDYIYVRGGTYPSLAMALTTTSIGLRRQVASTADLTQGDFSSTAPFTWTTNDLLMIKMDYFM